MPGRSRAGAGAERRLTLREHLVELRRRMFVSALALLLAAVAGFFLAPVVTDALRVPIDMIAASRSARIAYTTVTGAFDLRMQIALTIAVLLSSPVWLYQVFAFLLPGLSRRERRYTLGFVLSAVPLFLLGGASGWFVFPHMVELLTSIAPAQDSTFLDARIYYDFVLKLVLVVAVAFVLPVFLVLLNFAGVISGSAILRNWRWAILAIGLFTAIATPAADVLAMFLLAIPMIVLYLAAAGIAELSDRRRARALKTAEADVLSGVAA